MHKSWTYSGRQARRSRWRLARCPRNRDGASRVRGASSAAWPGRTRPTASRQRERAEGFSGSERRGSPPPRHHVSGYTGERVGCARMRAARERQRRRLWVVGASPAAWNAVADAERGAGDCCMLAPFRHEAVGEEGEAATAEHSVCSDLNGKGRSGGGHTAAATAIPTSRERKGRRGILRIVLQKSPCLCHNLQFGSSPRVFVDCVFFRF